MVYFRDFPLHRFRPRVTGSVGSRGGKDGAVAMELRQGRGVPGTEAGADVSTSQRTPRKTGSHRAKRRQRSSGGGGAAGSWFLASGFQAVRDEVTGGSATGPYSSSPTCHTYCGLQEVDWGAEARDLCGWVPGTKARLQILRACCPDPTPPRPQEGEGSPERDTGVREATAGSWFAPLLPVWRDTNDLLANGKHRFITPDV